MTLHLIVGDLNSSLPREITLQFSQGPIRKCHLNVIAKWNRLMRKCNTDAIEQVLIPINMKGICGEESSVGISILTLYSVEKWKYLQRQRLSVGKSTNRKKIMKRGN